jgi:hypothetical protein
LPNPHSAHETNRDHTRAADYVCRIQDPPLLRRTADESVPPEQEKMTAAKRAAVRLKEPSKSCFDGILGAHAPKIDGSAMRAARQKEPRGADHDSISVFMALGADGPPRFGERVE